MKKRYAFGLSHITSLLCLIAMLLPDSAQTQCNNELVLSLTGPGTSIWVAPAGGPFEVRISVTGAGGGAYLEANPDRTGGTGATMSGTFVVQSGETLRAIAGGGGNHSQLEGGGAGGGSGAVNCGDPSDCPNGEILIIAAGGNGGELDTISGGFGLGGSASTGGSGNGGLIPDNDAGGGGGALNGSGQNAGSGGKGGGQVSPSGISLGGAGSFNPISGNNKGGDGMGGGGGGGDGATDLTASGGGGGHTGADGGNSIAASSFNSGSDPADADGFTGGAISGAQGTPANAGTVTFVCLQALPVELLNFKAVIQNSGDVALLWSTASEKDNRGYDVERSADNRHWSALGFVPGSGTSAERRDYTFTDKNPFSGVNYYRLKQMDFDGSHEHSPMVVADLRAQNLQFDVFPNPSADGIFSFRTVSRQEGDALLEIFDWAGYKVFKEKIHLYEGTTVWPVSLATFPKGAYTARLEMPDGTAEYRKILMQ